MAQASLKDKAVNGVFWTTLERMSVQVMHFAIGLVLARLLAPEDYGVVGMTAIFFAIASTLIDSGFASSLIQNKNRTEADYCTCFYFNVVVGFVLASILFLSAPLIADFYDTPILKDVTRVSSACMFLGTLSGVPSTKLTIQMRFKEKAIISMSTQVLAGIVGIALALNGWGVWALVFQGVAGLLVSYALLQYFCRWWPRERFSVPAFKRMFSFGSKVLLSSMINTIYRNLYTMVIGRTFTASDVGYYNRSNGYASLPSNALLGSIMSVAYPVMSELQDDNDKLRNAYKKFLRLPCFILYPMLVGLAVVAAPMIEFMIGAKWLPCVPLLQVLCIGFMFEPLTHINLNILYVKGRTDLVLKLELIKKPIAFIILFGMIPFGLWWLCFGKMIYNFIAYCFNCYYTGKFINYGFWKQMYYNVPVFAKAAFMGLATWLSMLPFEAPGTKVLVGIPTGIVVYLLTAVVTKDESFGDLVEIVKSKRRKR